MNCVSGNVNVSLGGEFDRFEDVGSEDRPLTSTMFSRGMYLCMELRIKVICRQRSEWLAEMKASGRFVPDSGDDSTAIVYYW